METEARPTSAAATRGQTRGELMSWRWPAVVMVGMVGLLRWAPGLLHDAGPGLLRVSIAAIGFGLFAFAWVCFVGLVLVTAVRVIIAGSRAATRGAGKVTTDPHGPGLVGGATMVILFALAGAAGAAWFVPVLPHVHEWLSGPASQMLSAWGWETIFGGK